MTNGAEGGEGPGPPRPLATTYAPSHPLDLARTIRPLRHGSGDPAAVLVRDGAWLALTTPLGPATLALARTHDGVSAHAWGPGAEWAIASVPDLCGASDDLEGFDATRHPVLHEAARRFPGLRLTRTNRVLDALVSAVLEQEVTTIEALRGWRLLVGRYGTPAPAVVGIPTATAASAPRLTVPPTAAGWRAVPSWAFHAAGITERRWRTVVGAAEVAPRLERTLRAGRGGPETSRLLRTLPGIGVWTAALTTQTAHGDPDSPAYGDEHIARAVCWQLARELLPPRVADLRMAELLEPWEGHRERVVRLLLATGVAAPRRGHRLAPPPHRSW
ncbi:3-methyladenine DNA glycosylase [Serinibacter arcticus]|uniref:3-methyladenine DNA glycosylase n=1 Tax=Serinibacter arcticus TaxID=1655435 RepID=A0A2U1ZWJ4_9MICO|nr:3-methyladenine DNA glycosylase [Serinibacter arcticus]PWD51310.1 3-methyladenine DNA glycosylase [Serinibacter arcticus]